MMKTFIVFFMLFFSQLGIAEEMRFFEIEWDRVEEAKSYEIEVYDETGERKIFTKKLESTLWRGKIKVGKYIYRLRAIDFRGVGGSWSDFLSIEVPPNPVEINFPKQGEIIKTNEKEMNSVLIQWEKHLQADQFEIKILSESGEIIFMKENVTGNKFKVDLPVGKKYQLQILPYSSDKNIKGLEKESKIVGFSIEGGKLNKPEIIIPDTLFIRKIDLQVDSASKSEHIKIFRQIKEKKWEKVLDIKNNEKSVSIPLNWPGGIYQISVFSEAPLYKKSDVQLAKFELIAGDRSEYAQFIYELRDSIDAFRGWYSQLSYLITETNYFYSQPYLGANVVTEFSTLTGTGRIGVGYLNREKSVGFLGILDLSGLITKKGKDILFSSLELRGIYRTRITDRDDLRLKFGFFYKELPIPILDLNVFLVTDYSNFFMLGPMMGLEYWFSINSKFGFQFHYYYNYGLLGKNPINSEPLTGSVSQVGLLGSYRINRQSSGCLGLAMRDDSAFFKVNDGISERNSLFQLKGLFLNLFYERAF